MRSSTIAGVAFLLLQEVITSGTFWLQRILDPNMVEHRRAAAAKALARAASMGIAVDGDPKFAELVEEWAAGHITMREARDQYIEHIREREGARGDWRALSIQSSNTEIKSKLRPAG